MRKRITLAGLVLLLMLLFTGCGSKDEKKADFDQQALEAQAQMVLDSFQQMSDDNFDEIENMSEFQLNSALLSSGFQTNSSDFIGLIEAWRAGLKECGDFVSIDSFKMQHSGSGAVLSANAQFSNRDALVEFAFNEHGRLANLTISAHYGVGEILKKAVLNTILGMGTVFIVLIFISYMISLFKVISVYEENRKKKQAAPVQSVQAQAETLQQADSVQEDPADDLELVAVISAAIAAAQGGSPDGFVVRSIKRRKTNKWA